MSCNFFIMKTSQNLTMALTNGKECVFDNSFLSWNLYFDDFDMKRILWKIDKLYHDIINKSHFEYEVNYRKSTWDTNKTNILKINKFDLRLYSYFNNKIFISIIPIIGSQNICGKNINIKIPYFKMANNLQSLCIRIIDKLIENGELKCLPEHLNEQYFFYDDDLSDE